jgi:Raf kinase inhibitor-like YbhB/YbcL family protein
MTLRRHHPALLAWILAGALGVTAVGCGSSSSSTSTQSLTVVAHPPTVDAPSTITVSSSAMNANGTIPDQYTCVGAGTSPPLAWSQIPAGTRQLALIVTDPDAPGGTFFHWTTYAFAPSVRSVAANSVPHGALQGLNGGGKPAYYPMCPPKGAAAHHYHFTVYALRSAIGIGAAASPTTVMNAIKEAAIAQGALVVPFAQS